MIASIFFTLFSLSFHLFRDTTGSYREMGLSDALSITMPQ
jgi:hypothetical protein